MKLDLDASAGAQNSIDSYDVGQVVIAGTVHTRSMVVTADTIIDDWPPERFEALQRAHFEHVAALEPEVVILGTGARLRFPDPNLIRPLAERRIGLEVMDTGAACRSYNILVGEGRRVAAAILMIES